MGDEDTAPSRLTICATCADTNQSGEAGLGGGARLMALIRERHAEHPYASRIELRTQRCLMACTQGCVASVSGRGKMQYLLGRMAASEALAEQLLDFAAQHADAPTGVTPNHLWPPLMALHFLGRVPPYDPVTGDWTDDGCDL